MQTRLKVLGIVMVVAGFVFIGVGGFAFVQTQAGAKALQAFSAAQAVTLAYNDQGQLTDRGDPAEGAKILKLLTDDWGYSLVPGELDPKDPLVNTRSEYMVQMATIAYHTLNSKQTVTLTDHSDYKGTHYDPGQYSFAVAGRYWSEFDRNDPVQAKAREQAWTGTAQALIAELGVGSVTAAALQIGLGIAALAAALGVTLLFLGGGLIWAGRRSS